jgi:hypothetical protein
LPPEPTYDADDEDPGPPEDVVVALEVTLECRCGRDDGRA